MIAVPKVIIDRLWVELVDLRQIEFFDELFSVLFQLIQIEHLVVEHVLSLVPVLRPLLFPALNEQFRLLFVSIKHFAHHSL